MPTTDRAVCDAHRMLEEAHAAFRQGKPETALDLLQSIASRITPADGPLYRDTAALAVAVAAQTARRADYVLHPKVDNWLSQAGEAHDE